MGVSYSRDLALNTGTFILLCSALRNSVTTTITLSHSLRTNKMLLQDGGAYFVSFAHAVSVLACSFRMLLSNPANIAEQTHWFLSSSIGYFIHDLVTLNWVSNPVDVIHHLVALGLLPIGFISSHPQVMYYINLFVLAELSTPFLNIKWLLERLNLESTMMYRATLFLFLLSFVSTRIILLPWITYKIVYPRNESHKEISKKVGKVGFLALIGGNLIQWFWLVKMMKIIRRRFHATLI